jgi:hypothetical protein
MTSSIRLHVTVGELMTQHTRENPGFYLQNSRVPEDPLEDFYEFYAPLERALIARLQSRNSEGERP